MARPRTTRRKTKPASKQDTYTAELTSSQLVIGVCVLLMFGLACFLTGILIGKFDSAASRSARSEQTVPAEADAPTEDFAANRPTGTDNVAVHRLEDPPPRSKKNDANRSPRTSGGEGRQVAPRPNVLNGQREPGEGALGSAAPGQSKGPRPVDLPAPPPPRRTVARVEDPAPLEPDLPLVEPEIDTPSGDPGPSVAMADLPPDTLTEPADRPETPQSADLPRPTPASAQTSDGPYTVQIGAYSLRKNANAAQQRIQSKAEFPVEIALSQGGKLVMVYAGRFSNRDSADKARDDLRTRLGYTDCFVTQRP